MQNTSHTVSSLRHSFLNHLKLMNYKMTVDLDRLEATVHTPGLSYTDFDSKCGKPKPWQLMKFVTAARYFAHHEPLDETGNTFRDYAKMTADRMTFLVTSVFDFRHSVYNPSIPKCPLVVKVQHGYVGNTSCNSSTTVLTQEGEELFSNVNQVVSVDKTMRKPLPLPEWWKKKFSNTADKFYPLKFERYSKPPELVPLTIRVMHSDVDGYHHTNWSSYIKYSVDTIYHFSKQGSLPQFSDIEQCRIQRMEILYSNESLEGDNLDVFVWEQPDSCKKLNVHIYKGNDFLFQATFQYFVDM